MITLQHKYEQTSVVQPGERKSLVDANNLGVKYVIGSKREDVQSRAFNSLLRRYKKKELWALKDVSFVGYSGDVLGIVGFNGAGKTTLCRVISGLLRPDTGKIRVAGKVSALLTLGTGFNYTLSGRENVFLNGMMLGISRKHLFELLSEIINFSGLGHFIDEPLKNYSSGMRSRLAFSIAAMIEPEVLIIDEALSAGDLEFSNRAGGKLQQLISKSKIVIVVTHQIGFVEKFCTRAIWLNEGLVRADGLPAEVVKSYKKSVPLSAKKVWDLNLPVTEPKQGDSRVVIARNMGVKFSLNTPEDPKADGNNLAKKLFWGKRESFWALKDISFTVNEGDVVGVIGRNGVGKTTLCRIISNILIPDKGKIFVNGNITALLSFGAGFNIQLTGRDNIFLNGMMLGISKKVLTDIYFDIVEFSGLSRFIDQPVKNYSSGMRSRLGFSIAAMINPDLLIIDETLSAGDIMFYEKASAKIQELMANSKAAIVVTHNMAFVENVCTRAVWIDEGIVKFDGSPRKAVDLYTKEVS